MQSVIGTLIFSERPRVLICRIAGPIPLADINRKEIAFSALPYARTNYQKHNIRVSASLSTS